MNKLEYNKFTVNIYDIFANLLPGYILIGGVLLPFLDSSRLSSIGLMKGTFLTLAAFAIGGGTQALGSYLKYYQFRLPLLSYPSECDEDGTQLWLIGERILPFNNKMEKIKNGGDDLSIPADNFFQSYNNVFGVEKEKADFEDWGYLFKTTISYLEASPYNRTLRIQAQHLAARGIYITLFCLSLYYFAIVLLSSKINNIASEPLFENVLSDTPLAVFGVLCLLFSYVFYIRSVHFEEDVVNYIISEIFIASGLDENEEGENAE